MWDAATGCSLKPPPSSITFSLMVTLVCYFFSVPMDQIIGYIQDEYASRHPGAINNQPPHPSYPIPIYPNPRLS